VSSTPTPRRTLFEAKEGAGSAAPLLRRLAVACSNVGCPDVGRTSACCARRTPASQRKMLDLTPWRPVSSLPPVRRDLSIVTSGAPDEETLGETPVARLGGCWQWLSIGLGHDS